MARNLSGKRSVLIAHSNSKVAQEIANFVKKNIHNSQVYFAEDGIEATNKIVNSPPHITILDINLRKKDTLQIVQWVLDTKSIGDVACIILSEIPDTQHFVDEVVLGKVQFLENWKDVIKFSECINRAFNFLANDGKQDFHLKFLNAGERLMCEGDKATFVYLVRKGQLKASIFRNDQEILLGEILEGEFVGEMAYINGEARSADVTAMNNCELIEIPISLVDVLLFQKPSWSKAFMQTLSKRLKRSNDSRS